MSLTVVQIILYIIQENTEYLCEFDLSLMILVWMERLHVKYHLFNRWIDCGSYVFIYKDCL